MTIKDILDVINDLHIDYKISILDDFEINTYCSLNELKEIALNAGINGIVDFKAKLNA